MPGITLHSELLRQIPRLKHGFSTAEPASDSNAPPLGVSTCRQIHSDQVHEINNLTRGLEGDALITTALKLPIAVLSADCTPILAALVSPEQNILGLAAIHAGWRGTAAGIAGKAIRALILGKIPVPANSTLFVAIGPCIQGNEYEVGAEVVKEFPAQAFRPGVRPGKFWLNLPFENRRQIELAATEAKIHLRLEDLAISTLSTPHLPSYRRDGSGSGRILSFLERC